MLRLSYSFDIFIFIDIFIFPYSQTTLRVKVFKYLGQAYILVSNILLYGFLNKLQYDIIILFKQKPAWKVIREELNNCL